MRDEKIKLNKGLIQTMGFNYTDISAEQNNDCGINLFFGDHCIATIENKELSDKIRKITLPKGEVKEVQPRSLAIIKLDEAINDVNKSAESIKKVIQETVGLVSKRRHHEDKIL